MRYITAPAFPGLPTVVKPMSHSAHSAHDRLRDFTADRRVLILAALAVVAGTTGAGAAWVLARLINLVTNLAYFGKLSVAPVIIADNTLGLVSILVPIVGCLVIGLMARYGSEKIRGHGIPEAIEAILIGRSRIQAKVALLKPLSFRDLDRHRGPIRRRRTHHHDGRRARLAVCAALPSLQRRTQDVAGGGRGGRHERHIRHPDRRHTAGRGIVVVRVEAAQLRTGRRSLGGRRDALLPLAIGCAAAHTTTVLLLKRSILTEKVARRGHHITREYVIDPFETVRVSDIMARPAESLPANWTVGETLTFFTAPDAPRRHKSYPVADQDGKVLGMVSRADALRWLRDVDSLEKPLHEQVAGQELVVGYDDELTGQLADRMTATDTGRIPILSRKSGALVGLVARRDLLRVRANVMRQEHEREALIRVLPSRRAPEG